MSDNISIPYTDEKANAIEDFDTLAKLMWMKVFVLNAESQNLNIIDSCAGGGKLLSFFPKEYSATGYEENYSKYKYATGLLNDTLSRDVKIINEAFEFHFANPNFTIFDIAVSIPYTQKSISGDYEQDKKYTSLKNYAFYCILRSMEIVKHGGYGVFAIPIELINNKNLEYDKNVIFEENSLVSSESFNNFVILTLQRK